MDAIAVCIAFMVFIACFIGVPIWMMLIIAEWQKEWDAKDRRKSRKLGYVIDVEAREVVDVVRIP